MAASDTTYHSFQNLEAYQMAPTEAKLPPPTHQWNEDNFEPTVMRRQDSGYESLPSKSKPGSSALRHCWTACRKRYWESQQTVAFSGRIA